MTSKKNPLNHIVGENIRRLRKELTLSQEELADRANLHRTYIGGIERGERNITLQTLEQLAKTLGVAPEVLLKSKSN